MTKRTKTMAKQSKSIKAKCNQVTKNTNSEDARFNVENKDGQNIGNVRINLNTDRGPGLPDDYEPGKEYVIFIKEA